MTDPIQTPIVQQDPRYVYEDIGPTSISVARLDQLMTFVMDAPQGTFGAIISGVKILVVTAYMVARERLIAQSQEYSKQQYERKKAADNQSVIDHDTQGNQPRKNIS